MIFNNIFNNMQSNFYSHDMLSDMPEFESPLQYAHVCIDKFNYIIINNDGSRRYVDAALMHDVDILNKHYKEICIRNGVLLNPYPNFHKRTKTVDFTFNLFELDATSRQVIIPWDIITYFEDDFKKGK